MLGWKEGPGSGNRAQWGGGWLLCDGVRSKKPGAAGTTLRWLGRPGASAVSNRVGRGSWRPLVHAHCATNALAQTKERITSGPS